MRKIALIGFAIVSSFLGNLAEASPSVCSLKWAAKAKVGRSCQTSKGVLVTRTVDGWLDEETRRVWWELDAYGVNQHRADAYCSDNGWALPTGYPSSLNGAHGYPPRDSDFVSFRRNGLNEVMMMDYGAYWSSSIFYDDEDYAFIFYKDGYINRAWRPYTYDASRVRCISK